MSKRKKPANLISNGFRRSGKRRMNQSSSDGNCLAWSSTRNSRVAWIVQSLRNQVTQRSRTLPTYSGPEFYSDPLGVRASPATTLGFRKLSSPRIPSSTCRLDLSLHFRFRQTGSSIRTLVLLRCRKLGPTACSREADCHLSTVTNQQSRCRTIRFPYSCFRPQHPGNL